jgi:hypothetical protein
MIATIFQTSDPFNYLRMLQATSLTAIEYCKRHGHYYESFVGLKRGVHAYQATFNRILQFQELVDRGFTGWGLYMDADAYIVDLGFDLARYLRDKADRAAILVPSGATTLPWDINAGVVAIHLGHPLGRELVAAWLERFLAISDAQLCARAHWMDYENDQHMLSEVLRTEPRILAAVHFESKTLMNSEHASFIRQHLRAYTPNLGDRICRIEAEVARILPHANLQTAEPLVRDMIAGAYQAVAQRSPDPTECGRWSARFRELGIDAGMREMLAEILPAKDRRTAPAAPATI